ncbi:Xylose isomerase domain-containing protein TIM barrel [Rhodopirellula maiorica SM1]|uniref:Xylose isomerase domain-containing protein TIM barrel n=1 Tax=Rhodopirellula maiorica SM1 TaxID=1265738 RepID=M5RPB6_9BACT|nr:Xylose isomerase domain-containing protein TIM barrel [Rhodopirellula maiorica SM1]
MGVAVDVYHVWWDPDLSREIKLIGEAGRLFGFHVCDWRVPTRDLLTDRALMGDGCIDVRGIRAEVEAAGFEGWIEVEIFSEEHWASDQGNYLDKIIERYETHS